MLNGKELKNIRETLGYSLRDFSKELGLSYSMLHCLESGKRSPSSPMFTKIVKALKRFGIIIEVTWRHEDATREILNHFKTKSPAR